MPISIIWHLESSKDKKSLKTEFKMSEQRTLSIVDYLKEIGEDSSFAARKTRFAVAWPAEKYTGTAEQNLRLLKHIIEQGKIAVVPFPSSAIGDCASFYNDPAISKKLTEAFKSNAISACVVTGASVASSIIRKELQKAYIVATPENGEYFTTAEHKAIHDKAYLAAGCTGTSAHWVGWFFVNHVDFWDWAIRNGIAIWGACNP